MNFLSVLILLSAPALASKPCPEKIEERVTPCTASYAEQAEITQYARLGVKAYKEYEDALYIERTHREAIIDRESQGQQVPFEWRTKLAEALTIINESEPKMQSNLDKALELTSLYYGLGREMGSIANGPLQGYSMDWKPRFVYAPKDYAGKYLPVYRKLTFPAEKDKPPHYLIKHFSQDKNAAPSDAQMNEDGSVNFSIETFVHAAEAGNPRAIAATLHHEGVHFDELVTNGWESTERLEAYAYGKGLETAYIFELTHDERMRMHDKLQKAEDALAGIKSGEREPSSPFSTANQREKARGDYKKAENEFTRIEAQRRTLEEGLKTAREAVERERLEREKREDEDRRRRREEIDKAERARDAQLEKSNRIVRWSKFAVWTLHAAEYLRGVRYGDSEWGNPQRISAREAALREYLRSNLVVLSQDEIDAGLAGGTFLAGGELGSLQEAVIRTIYEVPGPMDVDWLMDQFEYQRRGGRTGEAINRVLASIGRAAADGAAAIVKTVNRPFSGERGSKRGEGRRNERNGSDRAPSDGPGWRQLRGIADGKGSFD